MIAKLSIRKEEGSLLYLTIMAMTITFVGLFMLNDQAQSRRKDVEFTINVDGLALNVSEAGLFEALAQFRNKGTMSKMSNPERDGNGDVVVIDGEVQYLEDSNYVDFDFEWICKQTANGCTKILDSKFHFQLDYKDNFDDLSSEICDICTNAGREQKGFYVAESEEPKIGIVRNFDVLGKTAAFSDSGVALNEYGDLKVRYEVWQTQTEDYSQETGESVSDSGRVWIIKSIGMVYKVFDLGAGQKKLTTYSTITQTRMVQKPSINFHATSALYNTNPNGYISLNANAQVINRGDPLVVDSALYGKHSNVGAAHSGNNIIDFRNNGDSVEDTTPLSFESVFGLDESQMIEFADTYIDDLSDPKLFTPITDSEIRYIVGNVTYGTDDPLLGDGILIIDGDCTIGGFGHSFSGILWVNGDLDIKAGGSIAGVVVSGIEAQTKADLKLQGLNGSNWFYVYYDPDAIDTINNKKFKYTMFRVPYVEKGWETTKFSDDQKTLREEEIFANYTD